MTQISFSNNYESLCKENAFKCHKCQISLQGKFRTIKLTRNVQNCCCYDYIIAGSNFVLQYRNKHKSKISPTYSFEIYKTSLLLLVDYRLLHKIIHYTTLKCLAKVMQSIFLFISSLKSSSYFTPRTKKKGTLQRIRPIKNVGNQFIFCLTCSYNPSSWVMQNKTYRYLYW